MFLRICEDFSYKSSSRRSDGHNVRSLLSSPHSKTSVNTLLNACLIKVVTRTLGLALKCFKTSSRNSEFILKESRPCSLLSLGGHKPKHFAQIYTTLLDELELQKHLKKKRRKREVVKKKR